VTADDRPVLDGPPSGMSEGDRELLEVASGLLAARYRVGVHEVAAALRLADGSVVTGLHVEATAGRASVCAESAALSAAVVAGSPVVAVVGVLRRPGGSLHLIEPCGVCAELLVDHAPATRVWVAVDDGFGAVPVAELLPFRRRRAARQPGGGRPGNSTTPEV
jgi:cytidine deaminase